MSPLVPEVKKPPPPVTKEPNTGQTIHPPDTPDSIEALPNKTELIEKKETRVKGKRKLSKQQKKEEKARKKDKGRDKENKEIDKTDAKQRISSYGDSTSSNSTEQLETDNPPSIVESTIMPPSPDINVKSAEVATDDKLPTKPLPIENDAAPIENKEVSPVVPAVPSSAIKTGRAKRQNSKEVPPPDTFSRVPDRSTYSGKKNSTSKKPPPPPENVVKQPVVVTKNISPPVEVNFEHSAPPEAEVVNKPRPQTLPVIIQTEEIKEPVLDIPIDLECSIETETDDVPQTLLSVESSKNGSQSLPTSPHELAASLLSKNSVMKRRKKKGHLDKPDDDLEDEDNDLDDEQPHEQDEQRETEILEPIEPQLTQRKDEYDNHDQFKPLSTLSLNAEPFYPSPSFVPKSGPNSRGDLRKFGPEPLASRSRRLPPGLSPTPDDPYMRPYPDMPYYKRPHPSRGGKSMTPSPPLPYFSDGPPLPYGEYPPLDHDPMLTDEPPYGGPEDFPPIPMGRHSRDRYRGRSPMMLPKGGMSRQNVHHSMEAYMHHMYIQRARECGYRQQPPWEHPPSHRTKPPHPAEEVLHDRHYLRKRQYLMQLLEEERAIAAIERKRAKHSIETPPLSNFEPDISPSFGTRGWDTPAVIDPPTEDHEQVRFRPNRLLLDKPLRRRTYSTESDLGGEFVTDFPAASSVGAPGQQFSSRGEKTSAPGSKDLAPGRSRSAGWPEGTQVSV